MEAIRGHSTPLYAQWINLHGGWVQGLVMLGVYGLAIVAMEIRWRWLRHGLVSELRWPSLVLVSAACVAALFLNPYGARLVVFPLEVEAAWRRAMGPEWQSPFTSGGTTNGGRWLSGWQLVGGGLFVPTLLQLTCVVYGAVLCGVCLTHLRRWRTTDLLPVAAMLVWLGLSLRHLRAVSDATLMTAPLVAAGHRVSTAGRRVIV